MTKPLWFAVMFLIVLAGLFVNGMLPRDVLMLYAINSLLTVIVYHRDKYAAQRGRWRTPERTLHWLALAGGWPGAIFAQHWFRHKSAKKHFRRWFWVTVLANLFVLVVFIWRGDVLLASLR